MGWKSTKELTREQAIQLVLENIETLTNDELGEGLTAMFGDNVDLPHYGRNFIVRNTLSDDECRCPAPDGGLCKYCLSTI